MAARRAATTQQTIAIKPVFTPPAIIHSGIDNRSISTAASVCMDATLNGFG